jgi:hypothetical protein
MNDCKKIAKKLRSEWTEISLIAYVMVERSIAFASWRSED